MKKIFSILVCCSFLFAYDVDGFQDEVSKDIIKIQEIFASDSNDKSADLFNLLKSNLDVDLMSRLVLSKHYKELDNAKLVEFQELFLNRLKNDFSTKIDLVKGSSLKLAKTSIDDKKCQADVSANYEDQDKEIKFKFRKINNKCKLYDIEMLDTSIIASYRAQFLDIVRQSGINSLFEKLK